MYKGGYTGHLFRAIAWREVKIHVQLQRGGAKGPKKEIVRNKISSKSYLHWGGRPEEKGSRRGGHWRPRGGGRPEDRHWGGDPIEQRGGSFTRGGQSGAWCSGESERTPRRLRRQRWPEMSQEEGGLRDLQELQASILSQPIFTTSLHPMFYRTSL